MINENQLQAAQEAVSRFGALPKDEQWLWLRRNGSIHADGTVQDWHAKLAVLEVRYNNSGDRAVAFWCLIPSGGSPGSTTLEVSRQNMEMYLREGSRIITATVDPKTKALDTGEEIHLTSSNAIRTDKNEAMEDNLQSLPTYHDVRSRV